MCSWQYVTILAKRFIAWFYAGSVDHTSVQMVASVLPGLSKVVWNVPIAFVDDAVMVTIAGQWSEEDVGSWSKNVLLTKFLVSSSLNLVI